MRFAHPLVHRLRRLFRLSDHHVFYENEEGFVAAGCGLCAEFMVGLLKDDTLGERG